MKSVLGKSAAVDRTGKVAKRLRMGCLAASILEGGQDIVGRVGSRTKMCMRSEKMSCVGLDVSFTFDRNEK